jgi:hypothetical protein
MTGWYGIDLDGTLAEYHGWQGQEHIGAPVPRMMEFVKNLISLGQEVRIFTARAYAPDGGLNVRACEIVQDWLQSHGLPRLQVTNVKDYGMIKLFDDRAIQVEENTGRLIGIE